MTIYVDEIRNYGPKGDWCHMWTDGDDAELDAFANQIRLSRSWSHTSNSTSGRFYHYDLTPYKRFVALKQGAQFMEFKKFVTQRLKAAGLLP